MRLLDIKKNYLGLKFLSPPLSCENAFTMGRDEFPENTTHLRSKLNNWRPMEASNSPSRITHILNLTFQTRMD
jgi:hypothetical protein